MEITSGDKMKRSELKQMIKPIVKECIVESLIEEGLLTEVVSQVASGLSNRSLVESTQPRVKQTTTTFEKEALASKKQSKKVLDEHRRRMMDAIGKDAYNGVNLFEGTEPLREGGTPGEKHKTNVLGDDPDDAGVDLSSLLGHSTKIWSQMKK